MRPLHLYIPDGQGLSAAALAQLQCVADVHVDDTDQAGMYRRIHDAEIVWMRLRHRLDAHVLAHAPKLRWIVSPTTGLDHIDLAAAAQHNVRVLSLQGETDFLKQVRATAELTVGLMLSCLRHMPAAMQHVQGGGWQRDGFLGTELFGKTIGIIGFGRLGAMVARMLAGFDVTLLTTDPAVQPNAMPAGVQWVTRDTLLQRSDVVTLHVNLTPNTHHLIAARELALMQPHAWLINTARGAVIDESALWVALQQRTIAGAALDVLCYENWQSMEHHPLVQYAQSHANLLLTPHIGGYTVESLAKAELFMARKLCAALACEARHYGV